MGVEWDRISLVRKTCKKDGEDKSFMEHLEAFQILGIAPEKEESRLVLLRAERMYEETLEDRRKKLDSCITALRRH